jgi:CheY-like chemotaxis protein
MEGGVLVGQTILIVEEEPVIALDVRMALEGVGATAVCTTAHDAMTAIEERTFAAASSTFGRDPTITVRAHEN